MRRTNGQIRLDDRIRFRPVGIELRVTAELRQRRRATEGCAPLCQRSPTGITSPRKLANTSPRSPASSARPNSISRVNCLPDANIEQIARLQQLQRPPPAIKIGRLASSASGEGPESALQMPALRVDGLPADASRRSPGDWLSRSRLPDVHIEAVRDIVRRQVDVQAHADGIGRALPRPASVGSRHHSVHADRAPASTSGALPHAAGRDQEPLVGRPLAGVGSRLRRPFASSRC